MRRWATVFQVVMLLSASGCALSPGESRQSTTYYDFGPAAKRSVQCRMDVKLAAVTSNAALQGNRMWYRYAHSPFAPMPFAISRWSAPPHDLLRRQLSARFAGSSENDRVVIEILRLELFLQPDDDALVLLEVIASHHRANGAIIRQRHFQTAQKSHDSPAGTAQGAGLASQQLGHELCEWLEKLPAGQMRQESSPEPTAAGGQG